MKQEIIEKHLKQATNRAYWVGAALGLVFGLILGAIIGYDLGSDDIVVFPLEQGVET
jgi:uncharacterized membrane protein YgaE (UPF0421/DUF939 family)